MNSLGMASEEAKSDHCFPQTRLMTQSLDYSLGQPSVSIDSIKLTRIDESMDDHHIPRVFAMVCRTPAGSALTLWCVAALALVDASLFPELKLKSGTVRGISEDGWKINKYLGVPL